MLVEEQMRKDKEMTIQLQEITQFDERNIIYFAWAYTKPGIEFDDLYQEACLAALTAKKPEHKYMRIKQAVQEYNRKNTDYYNKCKDRNYDVVLKDEDNTKIFDKNLMFIDTIDTLKYVLEKTDNLNNKEKEVIRFVYLSDKLNMAKIGEQLGVSREAVRQLYRSALRKLHTTAERID